MYNLIPQNPCFMHIIDAHSLKIPAEGRYVLELLYFNCKLCIMRLKLHIRFAALENLNEDEDVNRIWGNIKHNIQTSAKESLGMHEWKQHKPWIDEECLGFLDQRKQAKISGYRIHAKVM